MDIEYIFTKGTWREVADAARVTIRKKEGKGEPSARWKKHILLAEHSPIRLMSYSWIWKDLSYWVSVHLVRHWLGIVHFVSTSRTDRTGIDRDKLLQDNPVEHRCEANAQALINISRKRLCSKAAKRTQVAWLLVKTEVSKVDPVMASVMVPECIYRGFCPEFEGCGYDKTEGYATALSEYRRIDL